ncbi:hypothetical protein, partial [Pseudomonas asturiensis]|uniref:hypothetical protein n=1 Tax=Pseudomonas asturiensis TaxID=1190415 RepID=UPI001C31792A
FEIGKAHLAHGRLGSGGQAYFSTFEDLFGDSLGAFSELQATKSPGKPKSAEAASIHSFLTD